MKVNSIKKSKENTIQIQMNRPRVSLKFLGIQEYEYDCAR